DIDGRQLDSSEIEKNDRIAVSSSRSDPVAKLVNKKRSYAQYHLELGQSNFLLHTCSVCGLRYARGDEGDEKVDKTFHKSYHEGIQFKGWCSERVVSKPSSNGDRILLVLDCDPPAQKGKVQEIIKRMEKELGFSNDQHLHNLCKVYLYQFGGFNFTREVIKSRSTNSTKVDQWDGGAILCEEEAILALCGFRAVWVVPSHGRKGIASQLLDVARKSFCNNKMLDHSQCAFSPPTSAGEALASRFSSSNSCLVYMAEDV
ncbi:protein CHROMOSOME TRANSMISSION FIDELITY 7, partial [Elaeis guineensis]|uniref:protein CHROMOSOME TRANSMISSION FIDELITY 7 n=1 Tax=Elaeis guineensis var. tenera TaxID=51953 RepID=UPI003C6D9366